MKTKYREKFALSEQSAPLFHAKEIGDVFRSINKSHKKLGLRRSWSRPGAKKPPTFMVGGKDIRL